MTFRFLTSRLGPKPLLSSRRPQVEELSERALPNGTPVAVLALDVARDVTELRTDLQVVQRSLATNTNAAVTADLSALGTSLTNVVNDVMTGTPATTDLTPCPPPRPL